VLRHPCPGPGWAPSTKNAACSAAIATQEETP